MNSLYLWFIKEMPKMVQNISVEQWLSYKWIVLAIVKAISSLSLLLDKLKWWIFLSVKGKSELFSYQIWKWQLMLCLKLAFCFNKWNLSYAFAWILIMKDHIREAFIYNCSNLQSFKDSWVHYVRAANHTASHLYSFWTLTVMFPHGHFFSLLFYKMFKHSIPSPYKWHSRRFP